MLQSGDAGGSPLYAKLKDLLDNEVIKVKESRNSFAVVFTYSFDQETPVYLFNTEEAAKKFLKESFEEEVRIDLEENEWATDYAINDDCSYALITNLFEDHEDTTEFRLGQVYL